MLRLLFLLAAKLIYLFLHFLKPIYLFAKYSSPIPTPQIKWQSPLIKFKCFCNSEAYKANHTEGISVETLQKKGLTGGDGRRQQIGFPIY